MSPRRNSCIVSLFLGGSLRYALIRVRLLLRVRVLLRVRIALLQCTFAGNIAYQLSTLATAQGYSASLDKA